jgi:hypothetical protein
MLRAYGQPGRSYSYRHVDLAPEALGHFFSDYIRDPEWTIDQYFAWKPQAAPPWARRRAAYGPPAGPAAIDDDNDIL